MAHGLGSGSDFGHQPEDFRLTEDELAENASLLGGGEEENLSEADEATQEVVEDESEALEQFLADIAASQGGFRPAYLITPIELIHLVKEEIIDKDEARTYLVTQGIVLG